MHKSAILSLLLLALFNCGASAADGLHALAMYGAPKYPVGFTHFDYVNPDAPKKGDLKLGIAGTFDSLNPFIVRGLPALGLNTGYLSLIYEPLMARSADEPFTLYGLLAESIDVPDNRSSITFHLNPTAQWSDGQPVLARDVLFSFTTLRDKGRPNHRTYYKKVAEAKVVDPHTISFSFKPDATGHFDREMPMIMGLMPVLPEHDWQDRDFNQTSLRPPIGSGPYRVTDINPGRSIKYIRNPNYWGRDLPVERGLYNFDTIQIDYYRDDGIALEAFKAGQYDLRRENNPTKWATAYDFPATRDGRARLEEIPHHRTAVTYAFVLNVRRFPFSDPSLRTALQYSFDYGWVNDNLFHGLYKNVTSYFPNSELAATELPTGMERSILEKYKSDLSDDVFTTPLPSPSSNGDLRRNLIKAGAILKKAGYALHDNKLYSTDNKVVAFEILLNDPAEEKLALAWARNLNQLGIAISVRTVDSAQYQRRLDSFDYDGTTMRWTNSLSPGNEQITFWGSAAADQNGSRNYSGIKNKTVDALATAIPNATTREELVATARALDRVLLNGHYIIPLYYLGSDNFAYWADKLAHPESPPLMGSVLESWWEK